jgi:hypothetical protein
VTADPLRRRVRIFKVLDLWVWDCTLCQPPSAGATHSFLHTVRNVRRHCERTRPSHHEWVRKTLDRRWAS